MAETMKQKELRIRLYKSTKGKIKPLGPVQNTSTRIEFICIKCKHKWHTTPSHILHNHRGCPECARRRVAEANTKSNEVFLQQVKDLHGDKVIPLESYVKDNVKIKFRCNDCNHEWYASPSHILQGRSCPHCRQSHGERKIEQYLITNDIEYISQYKFDDCKNILGLPFDFVIKEDNKILAAIEFDGQQHYEPVDLFGGEENLKLVQFRDKIKNSYCKRNHIPLLRIPYTEINNIEHIIDRFLHKHKLLVA